MIVSHKYKFIFVKTAKTAGTSIEIFLSQLCGESDIVTPIFPPVESHQARNYEQSDFKNHMLAREIKQRVSPDVWNSYYKFCVERNPWDKTLSHYHMLNYRAENTLSLPDYFTNEKFCVNVSKYTDASGELMVDRVLKYENLVEDLREVFALLGVPFNGSLGVKAKGEYRSDRKHYREVLSKEQAEIINNVFEREIHMHGYQY